MATLPQLPERSPQWSAEAMAMAAHAKVLSGNKLEQLVVRIQRHTGRSKEACWRLVIQHGIKGRVDHRRWTDTELDLVREEIVKKSVEEVAKKLDRTVNAIRSVLIPHRHRQDLDWSLPCDWPSCSSFISAVVSKLQA